MRKIVESLYRHQFFSLSGSIVACNLLSLLTMPLFTRIYPVEGFGYFAVFWSLTTILAVFSTLRLELALPLIEDPSERLKVAQTSWFCSLMIVAVFLLGWYCTPFPRLFSSLPEGGYFGVLVAAAALISATMQIQTQVSIKLGHLTAISWRHILEKLVVILTSIIFVRFATYGLILAQIAGVLAGALVLTYANRASGILFWAPLREMKDLLKKHRDFPTKNGPSTVLQILTSQLPPLLYASFFSVQMLGFFNLAQRLMDAPNVIVSSGLSVVYYRRMLTAAKSDMNRIFTRVIRLLTALLIVPSIVLLVFSKQFVVYAFGAQWEHAHIFLLLLLPLACSRMLFIAGQSLFLILRQLDQDLLISAAVFASTMTGVVLGYFIFGTVEGCVGMSSALTSLSYIAGLSLIHRSARQLEAVADKI